WGGLQPAKGFSPPYFSTAGIEVNADPLNRRPSTLTAPPLSAQDLGPAKSRPNELEPARPPPKSSA
ncbi:MAG: hypothetical protein Q8L84_17010, partial [Hyphomonas sp.]|nr:hypothetical protein [Hyphomonas sp.]